jgi:type II secretory pathway pseudopilin PulG
MSSTRRGSNLLSKKVIIVVAILAVGAVSAILVASSIAQTTTAQQQQQYRQRMMMGMMEWSDEAIIPQINGSVSVANETSNFINENVRVPFVAAAQTAQGQITNGTVFGGHLGVVQGYLVYKFLVADTPNQTGHLTVIDAGNGEVLYTSGGQPLGSFGHSSIFGPWSGGGHGHERGWGGPWKGHWAGEWQ